jgi:galactokinase
MIGVIIGARPALFNAMAAYTFRMHNRARPLIEEFAATFDRRPEIVSIAPGRVNLIGEHTDYNEGLVLPLAIDRYVLVAAAVRQDGVIRARSVDFDQRDEFPAAAVRRFRGSRGWRDYVRGVVWAFLNRFLPVTGADVLVTGDIPIGAGLSSSAALEVAVAGALNRISGAGLAGADLALLCQKAENVFVGVQCGIMDQMVSALGVAGHCLMIDCRDLTHRPVLLPAGFEIIVAESGVERNLADTPYNDRREECAQAARGLGVDSVRDVDETALAEARSDLPDHLFRRARHVVTENRRVRECVVALEDGDVTTAGGLMCGSHQSLRDDFEVSTPELDLLVELACVVDGVAGARLTGAGFGGCTVNLVREGDTAVLEEKVIQPYIARTGLPSVMHVLHASGGLEVTDV